MASSTPSKPAASRIGGAKGLGVCAIVLSLLGLAIMAAGVFGAASTIPLALNEPELASGFGADGFGAAIVQAGFGTLSDSEAMAGVLALVALFFGFGDIICVVSLVAGISVFRAATRPASRRRALALSVAGAAASFLTLRLISGIILTVSAVKVQKQRVADAGGAKAYYAEGSHLGPMRFVEIVCIAQIIMNVSLLLFVTRSDMFHGEWWINFVMLLMMAVTVWIIWNRREHGCTIICAMVAIYLVINAVYYIATGMFDPVLFTYNAFWPIVMLLYFGFSKQAHLSLSRPFKLETREAELKKDEKLWNPKSPIFWRNLVLYFCIFSVVGHWMEWSVCWLIRWGIVPGTYDPNSGIWHDMLNPFFVYGIAFVFIGLLLFPIKNWLTKVLHGNIPAAVAASFVVNTLFCAAIELALGFACNMPPDPVTGKLPLWDYQDMAFNFMGQICLLNTAFFGVMATIMTWLVYPALEKAFSKIPKDVMNIVTVVVVVVFFILVVCMYVINVDLASLAL